GIFSLILPAVEICENNGVSLYPVGLGFVFGVLFLILMDRTMPHLHYNESAPEGIKSHFGRGTLLFLAITIHNIPEGMAVGVSSAGGVTDEQVIASLILALGIGIQNIPEGAAVSMPCFAEGMSRFKAFVRGSLSGIVEPVAAILMVLLAEHLLPFLPWFLSFAAGAMIYVVVEELIPESHSLGHSDKATVSVLSGFLLMMMLDITLG
ncbi:MAG: ZIP family metal transporter, partial [Succinivibrio sp.]